MDELGLLYLMGTAMGTLFGFTVSAFIADLRHGPVQKT